MILTDTAELAGTRRTRDGYLVADVRAGRTGVQNYGGVEVGRPDLPLVRVYRPPEEVFAADAMATAAHRPVTNDHPREMVTAETWRDVAVGMTGGEIARDGIFLRVPMVVMDSAAVADIEDGKRQLSFGYACDIDWTAGRTEDGQDYDAIQRGIRINHLAVVDRARAGSGCRVGDADAAPPTPTTTTGVRAVPDDTRAVVLDGLTIRTNDAGAEAIARLQRQITDAAAATATVKDEAQRVADGLRGQIAALTVAHTEALQAKDGEVVALKATHAEALAAKDGELVATKAMIPDAAALDIALASRLACADEAARVFGDGFDPRGKSEAEMRRLAVAKRLGDALTTPMSDAEVGGAFRALAASTTPAPKPDPLRAAIASGAGVTPVADATPQAKAFDGYINRLTTAWKHADAKGAV